MYIFLTRVFFSWILQKLLYEELNFLQIFIKEFFKNFLRGFLLRNKFRSDLPWSYLPNTRFLLANSSKGFFKNFYLGNLIFLKSSTRNSSKISSRFLSRKQISVRSSLIVSSKQPFSSRECFKRELNFLQIFNKEFFKNFFKIFY